MSLRFFRAIQVSESGLGGQNGPEMMRVGPTWPGRVWQALGKCAVDSSPSINFIQHPVFSVL